MFGNTHRSPHDGGSQNALNPMTFSRICIMT